MAVYWVLFSLPVVWQAVAKRDPQLQLLGAVVLSIVFVGVIGLRDQVGCDWFHYLDNFNEMSRIPFTDATSIFEPGHVAVNQAVDSLGFSVHATNFVYAVAFVAGWMSFVRRQPIPWLALLLSVPYLVIVVAMGYTRQATAIGFLCLAFNAFVDTRIVAMLIWVLVATLFHKSALIFLGLLPIARGFRLDIINIAMLPGVLAGLYLMKGDVDQYMEGYVASGMTSDGGPARLIVTTAAGVLFLIFRSHFRKYRDYLLLLVLALISIPSLPLSLVASTATDRLALYLLPFQIAVFARLPLVFTTTQIRNAALAGVIAFYAAQQFVWLNYATNSFCWVPYRNLISSTDVFIPRVADRSVIDPTTSA